MDKIVKVTWWDAEDAKDTWSDEADIEAFGDKVYEVTSVGYQVKKTEKYITLAGDHGEDKSFGAVRKIPMGMVREIIELDLKQDP